MKTFMKGKKMIGSLEGNVFSKEVMKSKHLFRTLNAWGIDAKVLSQLPADTKIVIHEREEDLLYTTTRGEYALHGAYFHFQQPREDHDTQQFLPLKWFQVDKPKKLEGDELAKHEYLKSQGLI